MKGFLKKIFFLFTLFQLVFTSIIAQSEIEFEIQENKYYDCFLTKIVRINNGYLLKCLVEVAPNNAEIVWIVVPSMNMYYRGKHITTKKIFYHQGKYVSAYRQYSLSLKKYNTNLLGRKRDGEMVGDDYGEIADILLGKKIVSLQETFNIRTYYISLDFGTKQQNSDSLACVKEMLYLESIDSIQDVVNSFLYDFSYKDLAKTICNSCDTNQINTCFGRWGKSSYTRFLDPIELPSKRKFHYDWYKNKNFSQRIKICQEKYGLPFMSANPKMFKVTILNMQLLYWDYNLLTLRVQWHIHKNNVYSLVISLQRNHDKWKVVGIARKLLNE